MAEEQPLSGNQLTELLEVLEELQSKHSRFRETNERMALLHALVHFPMVVGAAIALAHKLAQLEPPPKKKPGPKRKLPISDQDLAELVTVYKHAIAKDRQVDVRRIKDTVALDELMSKAYLMEGKAQHLWRKVRKTFINALSRGRKFVPN